jgi:hypothetical protein
MSGGWTKGVWTLDNFPEYVDGTDMEVLDCDGFPIATVEGSPILNRWSERFPNMSHWADGADSGKTHRHRNQSELLASAALIAEAGTVANKTGLTPRQLADQRAELLAALEEICQEFAQQHPLIKKGRAAIARATAS